MTVLRRATALVGLVLWSTWAVIRASAQVARDVVAPSPRVAPAIIVLPLRARTRVEVATLTSLIALVPGTLPVGVSDKGALWVHGMYGADPERLRREVVDVETRVLRALRGSRATTEAPAS